MIRSTLRIALAATLLACTAQAATAQATSAQAPYARTGQSFAFIGDVPYGLAEVVKFDAVIDEINASRTVRLIVHSGDVKQGSERCDDALLQSRYDQFQRFRRAFIVTPGDNDWTDCHRANNGSYVPTERLARFRQIFYPTPGLTSGQRPFAVVTQAATPGYESYVENMHWSFAGITMATLHVVGSNNNLDPWSGIDNSDSYANPRADRIAEYSARDAANLQWIDRVFDSAVAADSAAVVISIQANPLFEAASTGVQRQGFNSFIDKLRTRTLAFGKPVLLTHGDSHYWRMDQPLTAPVNPSGNATLENFTRLENYGTPNVHWIEVFVDARDPNVFTVVPHIVAGNRFPR